MSVSRNVQCKNILSLFILPFVLQSVEAAPEKSGNQNSLFSRLGGKVGITALSESVIEELNKDERLLENPQILQLKKQIQPKQAKVRLAEELCKVAGGPCKPSKTAILKGNPLPHLDLSAMDWLYVIQDVNHAMDRNQLGTKERTELLTLLMKLQAKT